MARTVPQQPPHESSPSVNECLAGRPRLACVALCRPRCAGASSSWASPGGHDRAGDEHGGAAGEAARRPPRRRIRRRSTRPGRWRRRAAPRPGPGPRRRSRPRARPARSAGIARGEEFVVTTISDRAGSSSSSMPSTSLSSATATTPMIRSKLKSRSAPRTVDRHARRVVGGVGDHRRRAAQDVEPTRGAGLGEPGPDQVGVEAGLVGQAGAEGDGGAVVVAFACGRGLPRRRRTPRRRPARHAALDAWCAPNSGRKTSS